MGGLTCDASSWIDRSLYFFFFSCLLRRGALEMLWIILFANMGGFISFCFLQTNRVCFVDSAEV